ncbi:MocR-like pyridoxine biosynthesis transcription factor PdxR [Thalassotalea eurytherma]|uniref:GntR family transcriptional regulator n=1 Tax=Thalassotalea eurytherma TaxID=1144278 RepID=A0ABQ6H4U1_9GAMM|nr:PLP-dependent aminotransferase family protein [Thalassotalea eurytherma]GLX81456.1 GntR family transcriptional regulator [Thalassotalea eurytherma]
MNTTLIHIDFDKEDSLQSQIRQQLVEGILRGSFLPGSKLPSSRKLAKQLNVSRNTVTLVYQALLDEGYIISKQRSGIYVCDEIAQGKVANKNRELQFKRQPIDNHHRYKGAWHSTNASSSPKNWQDYQFPFIDGKYDSSLYPVTQWREANRKANAPREIYQWSKLQGIDDDPKLIEEIRSKILPRRGIVADRDEIIITIGSQQALSLITDLFVDNTVTVAVEEPGYPEMRELLMHKGASIVHQPVDNQGITVCSQLDVCDLLYTTPSHQTPTSVTMSMERRKQLLEKAHQQDLLVIEDDFEFESNFLGQPHPALKSLDKENRVVYVSCLSKVLASGIQIAFIVADSGVIHELRKLRKVTTRTPPLNNQRAVAHFLALGYYDSYMMHLHKIFFERWLTLREALNIYLPNCINTGPIQGGTAYWITGPKNLDGQRLREEAAEIGILIEPVKRYFATVESPENCFRMGITSISNERIRTGVSKLAELIHKLSDDEESFSNSKGQLLDNSTLDSVLSGSKLECQMVYGVPCVIELLPDGKMFGYTGGIDNETDTGRWWIENGMYCRQWKLWGYGEVKGFYVVTDGNKMKWFDHHYAFVRHLTIL